VRESTFWAVFFDFVSIFVEKPTNQAAVALCPNWRKVLALWGVEISAEISSFVQVQEDKKAYCLLLGGTLSARHRKFLLVQLFQTLAL
jgi:hypothetical protein